MKSTSIAISAIKIVFWVSFFNFGLHFSYPRFLIFFNLFKDQIMGPILILYYVYSIKIDPDTVWK